MACVMPTGPGPSVVHWARADHRRVCGSNETSLSPSLDWLSQSPRAPMVDVEWFHSHHSSSRPPAQAGITWSTHCPR